MEQNAKGHKKIWSNVISFYHTSSMINDSYLFVSFLLDFMAKIMFEKAKRSTYLAVEIELVTGIFGDKCDILLFSIIIFLHYRDFTFSDCKAKN